MIAKSMKSTDFNVDFVDFNADFVNLNADFNVDFNAYFDADFTDFGLKLVKLTN